MVIILTGVAGSGKTTVGRLLAAKLDCRFVDGDCFQPAENIEKLKKGFPLSDSDREPWLRRLRDLIAALLKQHQSAVIACSALKQSYRDFLQIDPAAVRFVYLKGDYQLIYQRLQARKHHFMKPKMLQSQFAILEEPSGAVTIDAHLEPEAIVNLITRTIAPHQIAPQ